MNEQQQNDSAKEWKAIQQRNNAVIDYEHGKLEKKMATYNELRKINVNEHTEKKGQLTYLSWAWAVDTLLQHDSGATWEFPEPKYYGETVMVFCNVTAFGKTMKMQLPVMDNRNNAIVNPDARKISDASMRCLAKCIATFGIGLYIYAGEDLPTGELDGQLADFLAAIEAASDLDELKSIYMQATRVLPKEKDAINAATNAKKASLS
jgi:hypothetical protein